MPALHPIRLVGPGILGICVGVGVASTPVDSMLADTQVALLAIGGILFTAAAYRNPIRARLGRHPLLGFGEVAAGMAVPIGVLGTGIDAELVPRYLFVAAVAAVALIVVVGAQTTT